MKLISFDDIISLNISPKDCFSWVEEILANKDSAFLPPKTHMNLPDNVFCNVMPSYVTNKDGEWGGVKVVTRYPLRVPSLDSEIYLFDKTSGEALAIMDGNWITAMRTGAVTAHSIILLAKTGFSVFGFLGLGNTARATLLVLLSVIDKPITVKLLRYKDQAETFIERFENHSNVSFVIVDSYEDVIIESDVVVSCVTAFNNDICEDSVFPEGILVVPVHTRGFTNCDLFFDKVYGDDAGHLDHFKNFEKFRYFAEISDVVNGTKAGRENDKERILAYNIGISLHDINFASKVYSYIEKRGIITADFDLNAPKDKFWV